MTPPTLSNHLKGAILEEPSHKPASLSPSGPAECVKESNGLSQLRHAMRHHHKILESAIISYMEVWETLHDDHRKDLLGLYERAMASSHVAENCVQSLIAHVKTSPPVRALNGDQGMITNTAQSSKPAQQRSATYQRLVFQADEAYMTATSDAKALLDRGVLAQDRQKKVQDICTGRAPK